MILTGPEIIQEVRAGQIEISPFRESLVNPNSYNYHLGPTYVQVDDDEDGASESKLIPAEGLIIEPGHLYLCNTAECIGSQQYVTLLNGKSSMGRLGLFLQISASLGHQGQIHQWTLEIRSCLPLRVYAGMIIGQVTFWKPFGDRCYRPGYYGSKDAPTVSRGLER
jgi:dCTP deaminase